MRSQPGFAHSAPGYYRQQQGHAAILFALFIPILFGIFTLGTDGARAVQDKARLAEAVEVASLAVAGAGSDDKTLAKAYIQDYFPYAEVDDSDITIRKINCENNASCQDSEQRFFEYQVSAKIHQPTWFPGNETIVGFGENYDVASGAVSRKYHAKTVDVIFVADFSGSMNETWDGKTKYKALVKTIQDINDELLKFNSILAGRDDAMLNRAGFTAYDYNTFMYNPKNDKYCALSHWRSSSSNTLKSIFNDKKCYSVNNNPPFYRISITSSFSSRIDGVISSFEPRRGTTASYQGLIDAAYMAYSISNPNPRQLIIILSDGKDYPDWRENRMTSLVKLGLCDNIIKKLESRESKKANGQTENVKARIAMIAFGYEVPNDVGLTKCVKKDNVFKADNFVAIKNKILELITEEIGHLAP
ncbi:TadE/TadG family type IV pilus assembly protein [Salinivibrio sp. AR640]|uniref:TadE/TadG family type IV pilus assembly protein n=1 Tax=Salinivibrio sp. AR640 TaxID=1909437 RepID=UPI0009859A3E|nr:TadE/TadG family type IV pilus assembly protein [Salinivibrio sp. AR640]OOE90428.1 hypothetical protein BZG75_12080 [Salinivibrio sp. AR640]